MKKHYIQTQTTFHDHFYRVMLQF